MPRFFFHLRSDLDALDGEGQDLPDVGTATERAAEYAREMAAAGIVEQRKLDLNHGIELADEAGHVISTIKFRDVLTIKG